VPEAASPLHWRCGVAKHAPFIASIDALHRFSNRGCPHCEVR